MIAALGSWPLLVAVVAALVAGLSGVTASLISDPARHVRGRLWLALGTFGLVLIASWVWSASRPSLLGLPIVVGPGAAATLAVLAFALPPARTGRSGPRRTATVMARSTGQVVGGRVLMLPCAALLVLVAVLITTGMTGATSGDAIGRSFAVERSGVSGGGGGGPYPGWFYGGPILLTAVVLVVAVAFAVRRTVLLPALTTDDVADRAWRAAVGRTLASIATAGLLLYLAGVLWAAAVAWHVLEQTGTTGLGPIVVAQGLVVSAAALAAVLLLTISAVRVATVGRAVTAKPVAA